MTILLTGHDPTRVSLIRIVRGSECVELSPEAAALMKSGITEHAVARGAKVCGLSTGVGVLKRKGIAGTDAAAYARWIMGAHPVGVGPFSPTEVVRETTLCLANGLARGNGAGASRDDPQR